VKYKILRKINYIPWLFLKLVDKIFVYQGKRCPYRRFMLRLRDPGLELWKQSIRDMGWEEV